MSVENVRKFLDSRGCDKEILEFKESTATVELAAKALGVEPELIAKTMSFKLRDGSPIVVVSKGTARIDNQKYKKTFDFKPKMLKFEEVEEAIGHPVGGVCPFDLKANVKIYLDKSLKKFEKVYPAAGNANSAIEFTPDELKDITYAEWVDISK